MRKKLREQIIERLKLGQASHSDLCENNDASPSTANLVLRELLASKQIHKMRVGRNVYYILDGHDISPDVKSVNATIIEVLSQYPTLTMVELTKKCTTIKASDVSKCVARLVFTSRIFRHTKDKSRHIHYSTSNYVEGLSLVNSKRRTTPDIEHETIGPYLKQFLFNLPIPNDVE